MSFPHSGSIRGYRAVRETVR